MYAGLRTNLPRLIMGFLDFPFDDRFLGSNDGRLFCSHQEVRLAGRSSAARCRCSVSVGLYRARGGG
jgi:hypothetical protein